MKKRGQHKAKKGMREDWFYKRGDIYFVDLGEPEGHIQGGKRPVINVQNNCGNFFSPMLLVVPLTSELKKVKQPTHFVLKHQKGLKSWSMSEGEQLRAINKRQVIRYLGKTDPENLRRIDETLRVSLELNEEDPNPYSPMMEFP